MADVIWIHDHKGFLSVYFAPWAKVSGEMGVAFCRAWEEEGESSDQTWVGKFDHGEEGLRAKEIISRSYWPW